MADTVTRTATILVVDDDPEVREIVAEILEDYGHRVLPADGGAEALRILEDRPEIELVITDVRMPDISGLELAARARRAREGLKVILISGYFMAQDVGMRVLLKPFRMSELQDAVLAELDG
ncbi:MAG: response regulator [Rhodospirillales bacterium]|nr:response regulator [Rhodospirillales bacterium]